jgi:methylglutaconyl-CoA hydratase
MSLVLVDDGRQPGITFLTLNRPEKRNALHVPLMKELCAAVQAASNKPNQRVIILRGAGPVFCAGLDLKVASVSVNEAEQAVEWVGRMLEIVHNTRLVTIAVVQGAAMAGGAGLMSACDFVVAADDARFGYPEIHRGLVAGIVMTFLRRQLRERDARELLLLGETIDAQRALAMGLVNRIVPVENLEREAVDIALKAMKGPPNTLARTKQLLDELWPQPIGDDVTRALRLHLATRGSEEAREGIAAFFEKRLPRWDPQAKRESSC